MALDLLDQIPAGAGLIALLSSDEFTPSADPFDRRLTTAAKRIALLLCADHDHAEQNARLAARHFGRLGAQTQHITHDDDIPADADLLYMGGGTPTELLDCLLNRPIGPQILDRWRAGLGLAGSSAGAMALSEHCLIPRPGDDKPTVWSRGLGPLTRVGLAVHATSRPQAWVEQVAATAPVPVLVMDDHAGVIVEVGAQLWSVGGVRIIAR